MSNAPSELKARLKLLYGAKFESLEITSGDALRAVLGLYVPQHEQWGKGTDGSKPLERLVSEILDEEAHISLTSIRGEAYVLRDIETVTLRVTHERRVPTELNPSKIAKEHLKEFHLRQGVFVRRKHRNSMSEKLRGTERNGGITHHVRAVRRAILEELRKDVLPEHVSTVSIGSDTPYLYPVPLEMREFPNVESGGIYETPFHFSDSYPGLVTRNRLHHFIWNMPDDYYDPDGYHEEGTNHYFKWDEAEFVQKD